ncbi:MAG: hypothetical protein Q4A94_08960 [Plesiomonas sp.]|nr:hypothetical protein [Plesiomonas sp.]
MNMLFSLFGVIMTILWLRFGRVSYAFLFVIFTILFVFFYDSPFIAAALSAGDVSNSTKIGYLTYYSKQFDLLDIFIFGQGYNAHTWSYELNELLAPGASKLELTYLELIRVYGLLVSSIFLFLVMWNTAFIKRLKLCDNNWIQPAIVSYLLMSFSNPYLFSMNGIFVLSMSVAYKYQNKQN